ncbi:MAG TPA: hypothetical protein VEQ60_03280, partial [Longimicrobium sp.]|nr:hypothetical protein [Longimicrobium sp.]
MSGPMGGPASPPRVPPSERPATVRMPLGPAPVLNGSGMDRKVPRRRWTRGRIAAVVVGAAVLAGAGATMVRAGGSQLRVRQAELAMAPVERRAFQEYIFVTGSVLPSASVFLDAV